MSLRLARQRLRLAQAECRSFDGRERKRRYGRVDSTLRAATDKELDKLEKLVYDLHRRYPM